MDKQQLINELQSLGFEHVPILNSVGPSTCYTIYDETVLIYLRPKGWMLRYYPSINAFCYYDEELQNWTQIPDQSLTLTDMMVLYG